MQSWAQQSQPSETGNTDSRNCDCGEIQSMDRLMKDCSWRPRCSNDERCLKPCTKLVASLERHNMMAAIIIFFVIIRTIIINVVVIITFITIIVAVVVLLLSLLFHYSSYHFSSLPLSSAFLIFLSSSLLVMMIMSLSLSSLLQGKFE